MVQADIKICSYIKTK